ncbi:MAG: hypothetical protein WCB11_00885 [Terriglobales bacterium]
MGFPSKGLREYKFGWAAMVPAGDDRRAAGCLAAHYLAEWVIEEKFGVATRARAQPSLNDLLCGGLH